MSVLQTKKKCPKCGKFKDVDFVIIIPMPNLVSGSWYCWNCHIYIDEDGKEDTQLMEILLELVAEEECVE